MCTYSKNDTLKVAEEDIICYKWMAFYYGDVVYNEKTDSFEPIKSFFTPFLYKKVDEDILSGKKPFLAEGEIEVRQRSYYNGYINVYGCGLIHTFKSLESFIKEYGLSLSHRDNVAIFKCKIPKGTKYVEGFDGCGVPCFSSTKIEFVEQLNINDYV